jgi:phosphatidate phosphatase APP1
MPIHHPRILAAAAVVSLSLFGAATPANALFGAKQTWIDLYGGWASQHGGHLYMRVHTGKPPPADHAGENTAEKLLHSIEQLELSAAKGATVSIIIQGHAEKLTATADDHGFIDFKLPAGMKGPLNRVGVNVVANKSFKTSAAMYPVPVWNDKQGQLGVISDVDDTLTDSDIPHKLHAGYNTIFHSAYDVKVFDGAGKVLSELTAPVKGFPVRPMFFCTGSPWQLHTRIASAFAMHGVPKGAFILRRFSKEPLKAYDFKHPHLQELFAMFPGTRWLLFGDTGEQDPEVYLQMSKEKPQQIEHIFIHNVVSAHQDPMSPRFAWHNGAGEQRMTVFDQWPQLQGEIDKHGYRFGHGSAEAKTGTK